MTKKKDFEETTGSIAGLGRKELKKRIRGFRGRDCLKLDFSEEHLNSLSVDRLRHILLAALINTRK